MKINENEKFKSEAGKVISTMLQHRTNPGENLTKTLNQNHPLNKILKICDDDLPPALPKTNPPLHLNLKKNEHEIIITPNINSPKRATPGTPPPSFIESTFPELNQKSDFPPPPSPLAKSPTNFVTTITVNTTPSSPGVEEPIVYRENLRNQTDNRSSIRKSLIIDNKVKENGLSSLENESNDVIKSIAEELNDGKIPVCCHCNKTITR